MTLGIFGIILTVFAIPGAFLGGKLDDRLGSKRTVQLAIAGVIVATIGIVGVTADRVLFVVPGRAAQPDARPVRLAQEKVFMAFALLLGFCMGPMQAASRTLIGRLAPEGMTRRILRPVRPVGPRHGLDGAARHWHRHGRRRTPTGSAWRACCSSWC